MNRLPGALLAILCLVALLPIQAAGAAVTAPTAIINVPGAPFNSLAGSAPGDFIDYFPSTQLIYLTDEANKSIDVIDPATNAMVARLNMADRPHQFFLDTTINMGAATSTGNDMAIFNFASNTYQPLRIGGPTDLGGYDPVNHIVAAGGRADTSYAVFVKLDPGGATVLSQLDFPARPEAIPYDSANGMFLALEATDIALIDPVTQLVTGRWDLPGCTPHNLAWGPNNEGLIGCTTGEVVINGVTGAIVARIDPSQVGGSDQVAYNPTTQQYLASGSVTRGGVKVPVLAWIDANSHQMTKSIDIDPGSLTQVAVDPASGLAYITTQPAVGGACLSSCIFVYAG